jgi:sugar-specific transcriptional regulator TrmB
MHAGRNCSDHGGEPIESDAAQVRWLRDIGLPLYAARAYLALLQLGVAEARAVSELASIPTAKVYRTLQQLQKHGLVEVTLDKPRKFAPISMEAFVDRQIAERVDGLESLRARREGLIDLFPIAAAAQSPLPSRMISIGGRRNVIQRFRDACDAASKEILVASTPDLASGDGPLGRGLVDAETRGVQVRMLRAVPYLVRASAGLLPLSATSASPRSAHPDEHVAIATFDRSAVLFASLPPQGRTNALSQASAVYMSEAAFVGPLQALMAAYDPRRVPAGPVRGHAVLKAGPEMTEHADQAGRHASSGPRGHGRRMEEARPLQRAPRDGRASADPRGR